MHGIVQPITVLCLRFYDGIAAAGNVAQAEHTVCIRGIRPRRIVTAIAAFYLEFYAGKRFMRYAVDLFHD